MRYAVLADIHANALALEAVLGAVRGVDGVLCLGDIVGVGPDPARCLDLVAEAGALCVIGDHDRTVLGEDTGKLVQAPELRDGTLRTMDQLGLGQLAYLRAQPRSRAVSGARLVHMLAVEPRPPSLDDLALHPEPLALVGHTHVALLCVETSEGGLHVEAPTLGEPVALAGRRVVANPGSVGQDRADTRLARYAVLDVDTAGRPTHLTFAAAAYDVDEDVERRRARMPAGSAEFRERFIAGDSPRIVNVRARHVAWYPVWDANVPTAAGAVVEATLA
jgi:predicted phosphodiesterase